MTNTPDYNESTEGDTRMISLVNDLIKKLPDVEARPYQRRIAARTLKYFLEDNLTSILIESPTGSGKTVMALMICRLMQDLENLRIGWVSHRRHLLAQAEAENINKKIYADISFISLFDKDPPTNLDLLVMDEAQHDACDSASHLHNKINPKFILGMTATPFRSDRAKLCFNKVIKDGGIRSLIEQGYLSPYKHWTIPEWTVETVANTYLRDKEEFGTSVFFFHTIRQCMECREILLSNDITCDVVTGSSDKDTQIEKFRNGETRCLINCMVLNEGFDAPFLKSAFIRPSGKGTTIQMGGRAFRIYTYGYKNIVQCKDTRWPFMKTAMPIQSFVWKHDRWFSLEPKTKEISIANKNALKSIAKINVELPKFITEKRKKPRRFRAR